ncbi:MAG: anhydro-N-acetylmuramic acid kinase, partial [Bacteroidia bacterium]|nr:anhydro-N-acetylmuramic acid kinase [Bacteroidia bacterium]
HLLWSTQIGKGAAIAAETGLPVVCDFRSTDVALGGQGAPLVPIGDQLLFTDYHYCLNLGGFANISFVQEGKRIAYDICPANMVLNTLANQAGQAFDDNGNMARSGKILPGLLESLNHLSYYHQPAPKSLGKEWVESTINPLLDPLIQHPATLSLRGAEAAREPKQERRGNKIQDLLHTFCEHIAIQAGNNTGINRVDKLLITGGGAMNSYLVERIRHYAAPQIILPDLQTIHFKEALIFAFLGLLRWRNEINILSSVTGAKRDSVGGAIYL